MPSPLNLNIPRFVDNRSLADVLEGGIRRKVEERRNEDEAKKNALAYDKESTIWGGLKPELEQELASMRPTEGAQPAFIPQFQEQSEAWHPPMIVPQAQQAPQQVDPYAARQSILNEQDAYERKRAAMPAFLALSPEMHGISSQRGESLKAREGLANRGIAQSESTQWSELYPALQKIRSEAIDKIGTSDNKGSIGAFNKLLADVENTVVAKNPRLIASDQYQKFRNDLKEIKTIPQPSMAGIMTAPPGRGASDFWAQQLATRQVPMESFSKALDAFRGPGREKFQREVFEKWAEIDPSFSPTDAVVGIQQAKDKMNNRTLGLINSIAPNFDKLKELGRRIGKSDLKMVSRAQMAASRQFSDADMAMYDALRTLIVDEANNIFAPGGGSDKSREMAQMLLPETLPAAQAEKVMEVVVTGLQNRKKGIESLFRGYKGPQLAEGETAKGNEWVRDPGTGKLVPKQ